MKEDSVFIRHMLDSIARIREYLQGVTQSDFHSNPMVHDAVIRNYQVLGEACKKVSPFLKARNSHVPWKEIAATRDKIIHSYEKVDWDTLWITAMDDLPFLEKNLEKLI